MERMTTDTVPHAAPVVEPAAIIRARGLCSRIYVDDKLKDYILNIVFATRFPKEHNLTDLGPLVRYGASPRASIYLLTAARAMAFLRRRGFVIPEDIKELAPDVLRHRLILSYEAEAEELTADDIVRKVLEGVEVP
jgi:MoxR-like ATPase